MNTKTLTFVSVGMILTVGLFVGSTLLFKPITKSVPIFMGKELVVTKTVAKPMLRAKRVARPVSIPKAVSVPAPQPQVSAPLPIVPPSISYSVIPAYPESALNNDLEGTVLLSVFVDSSGKAEKVAIKKSSGVVALDASAKTSVSLWKFSPATQGGVAMASHFEVPVSFQLMGN